MDARWILVLLGLCFSNLALAFEPAVYKYEVRVGKPDIHSNYSLNILYQKDYYFYTESRTQADSISRNLCTIHNNGACSIENNPETAGTTNGHTYSWPRQGYLDYVSAGIREFPLSCTPTQGNESCPKTVDESCSDSNVFFVLKYQSACVLNAENKFCRVSTKPSGSVSYVPPGETEYHHHTYYTGEICEPDDPTGGSYSPADGTGSVHYWPDSGATSTTPDPDPETPSDGQLRSDLDALRIDHNELDASTSQALTAHRNLIDNFSSDVARSLSMASTASNDAANSLSVATNASDMASDLAIQNQTLNSDLSSLKNDMTSLSSIVDEIYDDINCVNWKAGCDSNGLKKSIDDLWDEVNYSFESLRFGYEDGDGNYYDGVFDQLAEVNEFMTTISESSSETESAIASLRADFEAFSADTGGGTGTGGSDIDSTGIISAINSQGDSTNASLASINSTLDESLNNSEVPLLDRTSTLTETVVDFGTFDSLITKDYFGGSATCPPDVSIVVLGTDLAFSYQPFCDFAALVKPLILLLAWGGFIFSLRNLGRN